MFTSHMKRTSTCFVVFGVKGQKFVFLGRFRYLGYKIELGIEVALSSKLLYWSFIWKEFCPISADGASEERDETTARGLECVGCG